MMARVTNKCQTANLRVKKNNSQSNLIMAPMAILIIMDITTTHTMVEVEMESHITILDAGAV